MDEEKLQGQMIADLLNKISDFKKQAVEEKGHFSIDVFDFKYVANLLGEVYEVTKDLHTCNVQLNNENKVVGNSLRNHYAGLAMQKILEFQDNKEEVNVDLVAKLSFVTADAMMTQVYKD